MTSKDDTLSKIEEVSVALLIMHDVSELFICVENAFGEREQLLVVIIGSNDSLYEAIAVCIKDECCSK